MEDIPTVVFVLGGPGAGKGTQCENIITHCEGWAHISAGDCLREERNNPDSKDGALINERIKEGKIVPAEITVRLMLKKMKALAGKSKFLIDGFPRNADNVETWNKEVGKSAHVKGVFFFDTSEEEMEKRLLERGQTSGRNDDNLEAIKKRFKTYQNESYPIIETYMKQGLVARIDSSPPPGEVWKVVQQKVKEIEAIPTVVFVLGGPGAGKGTQCEKIIKNCDEWGHISAGDCLREERNNPDSADGALINERIKEGKIVPAEITVRLMLKKMKASEGKSKFLIDGFPRNADNVETWEREVGKSANVKGVFFFDTNERTMEKRLLERGKTSGRSDDNIESIRKRFKTYHDESYPIVESYKKQGLLVQIDASPEPDEVWKVVQQKVRDIDGA